MINNIKKFNYENIYHSEKLLPSNDYFKIVITTIYNALKNAYNNFDKLEKICPVLLEDYKEWISNYWNLERNEKNKNKVIFDVYNEKDYYKSIIFYISGMTDNYAIEMYKEVIGF